MLWGRGERHRKERMEWHGNRHGNRTAKGMLPAFGMQEIPVVTSEGRGAAGSPAGVYLVLYGVVTAWDIDLGLPFGSNSSSLLVPVLYKPW